MLHVHSPDQLRYDEYAILHVVTLSHTYKVLRTTIVDAGVSGLVEKLLSDGDHDVVTEAVATVCNLLSAAAPMKKVCS